jgi:nucleoside-diphosphate-sugar epimerase
MLRIVADMSETVLVTGGTGFVASWCIVELLQRGYDVRTTVRDLSKEARVRATVATAVDAGNRLKFFVADLTADAGWDAAVAGCKYVLHVASPLGMEGAKDPNAFIAPARDGTLRALRAAVKAGCKHVVITSSCAAASPHLARADSVNDETVWTDASDPTLTAYRKSKAVSERAAWEFMRHVDTRTALTTILPSAVFGPVLNADTLGSVRVIGRLLQGRVPGNPRLGFNVVDVRDLADVHIRAMTSPQAAGERFIASSDYMWMAEISQTLRARLGTAARQVPTRTLPSFVLRLMARFDPGVRALTPTLDRQHQYVSEKARRVLGWRPRPAADTVVDCAASLLAQGAITY